jgi:hypothetical protein
MKNTEPGSPEEQWQRLAELLGQTKTNFTNSEANITDHIFDHAFRSMNDRASMNLGGTAEVSGPVEVSFSFQSVQT